MQDREEDIKQLIREDNPEALELIYQLAGKELYCYLAGLTGSGHDAEELLHDLFIKIAGQREKLLSARQLKPYLFRMAANLAYDRLRQNQRQERRLNEYAVFTVDADICDESEEKLGKLNQALDALPPEQKEAVVMKIYLRKTFEEISGILAISANTAVSRYRYAIKKLKTMLEN